MANPEQQIRLNGKSADAVFYPSGLFQKLVNHPALFNDDDDDDDDDDADDNNNNNNNRLVSITNLMHSLFIL